MNQMVEFKCFFVAKSIQRDWVDHYVIIYTFCCRFVVAVKDRTEMIIIEISKSTSLEEEKKLFYVIFNI